MAASLTGNRSKNLSLVLANYVKKPSVQLQSFDPIEDGSYALIFSSANDSPHFNFETYDEAINELTANTFSIQPCSLTSIEVDAKNKVFRCIARNNTESKPYTEEAVKGLEPVKANMFIDKDDMIWKLEGEGDNKRLVRVSKQDFDSILESKKSRSPILSSLSSISPYEDGDYAYFFNHEINAMDFGLIVERDNKDYVFTRSNEKLVQLKSPLQVIVAHEMREKNPLHEKRKMIIAKDYSMEGYLEFLAKYYGRENPYFKAIEKAIKEFMVK